VDGECADEIGSPHSFAKRRQIGKTDRRPPDGATGHRCLSFLRNRGGGAPSVSKPGRIIDDIGRAQRIGLMARSHARGAIGWKSVERPDVALGFEEVVAG
jgi:hypothetical protein